jgi:hypothetical protein
VNWHSKRAVLLLIGAACLVVFVAGMAAAYNNRHHTICPDRKPPKGQRAGILGQIEYLCHDGRTVTTPG